MFILGECYWGGTGTECNSKEAITWFEKCVGVLRAEALYSCGDIYKYEGPGDDMDLVKAVEYYRKSSDLNYIYAQQKCIIMEMVSQNHYQKHAFGIRRRPNKTVKNDTYSQFKYGHMLIKKEGGDGTFTEGISFIEKAANQGFAKAIYYLAS